MSVTDHEGAILAWLAHDRRVLEVGTGLGVSTRAMAAQAYCVHTVDVDPWVHEHVWPSLPEDVQKGKTLPPWGDDPGMHSFEHYFNLVFIDGDHEEEAVKRDIEQVMPLLRRGGLLVLHDCNYDGVKRACAALGLKPIVMPTAGHLGLVFL